MTITWASRNRCSLPIILRCSLLSVGGREWDGGHMRPCPSFPFLRGPNSSSFSLPPLLEVEWEERRTLSFPLSFKSVPQSSPHPHPYTPFQLWRPLASKLGRGIPLLGSPPSHPHRRRVQVPSSSILTVSASLRHPPHTPPHLHPDPPSAPRSRVSDLSLPPTLHNSARLSPRGLRGRSTKGGAAAARLRMLLPPPPPFPPPSLLPPLPSTGPGALSQAMLVRCPGARGVSFSFLPPPPDPKPCPHSA